MGVGVSENTCLADIDAVGSKDYGLNGRQGFKKQGEKREKIKKIFLSRIDMASMGAAAADAVAPAPANAKVNVNGAPRVPPPRKQPPVV